MSGKDEQTWKKSLLTLPDDVFFALMRNYLGGIKTPFNKHDLVKKLAAFLRKEDTRRRIAALMDDTDRKVLSAVLLLESISPEDLYRIFKTSIPFSAVMRRIASLIERLLLFSDETGGSTVLKANPVLAGFLAEHAAGLEHLFDVRREPRLGTSLWLDERLIVGLLSFIIERPRALDPSGSPGRKDAEAFLNTFPGFDGDAGRSKVLASILRALDTLGIISPGERAVRANLGSFETFLSLPAVTRRTLLLSRTVFNGTGNPGGGESADRLFRQVIDSFPTGYSMPQSDFRGYMNLCSLFEGVEADTDSASEGLLALGVFLRTPRGDITPNAELRGWLGGEEQGKGAAVFQPNFDLLLPEDAPPDGFSFLPGLFRLKKYDRVCEFSMDQDSFISHLDSGGSADSAGKGIEAVTGKPLPGNIRTSLKLWEEKYRSINVYTGLVLTSTREMKPFLDHCPDFTAIVEKTLADGVYYLGNTEPGELRRILTKAGITHPPTTSAFETPGAPPPPESPFRDPLPENDRRLLKGDIKHTGESDTGSALMDELRNSLFLSDLPEYIKKEFENRIDRKLILHERQFRKDIQPHRQKEARGLDYPAKVRLIEEALAGGNSLLEIPSETASDETTILKPISLTKDGGDSVMTALLLPEEISRNIPVRKIARIRLLSGHLVPLSGL